jgi:hypothetical protein
VMLGFTFVQPNLQNRGSGNRFSVGSIDNGIPELFGTNLKAVHEGGRANGGTDKLLIKFCWNQCVAWMRGAFTEFSLQVRNLPSGVDPWEIARGFD